MTTKKKAKRVPKKKRLVKTTPGKSLREIREKELQGSYNWPWPLRPMQQEAWDKFEDGIKRFGLFWHRRAGKDVFGMSVARNQMTQRVGSYVHFFPKHVHAKRALWRGIDPRKGAKFIDIAFGDIEAERNNQDMMIEAFNGSTWTLLGSDNYDSNIIGGNVVGVVFSEWALCNPMAWEYIRPIVRENGGWAMFITTFRSRNHAWQMAQKLKDNPDWYIDIRPITDTCELDGSPIISLEDVQKDRDEGMKEALIQQEYFCNPAAVAEGAIYGREVEQLRKDTFRQQAAYNPNKGVYAVWNIDLPIHASCIIVQPGLVPQILDAWTLDMTDLPHALAKSEQYPFPILGHILPADQADLVRTFNDLDRHPQVLHNQTAIAATTNTSTFIQRCHIDLTRCELLLDAIGGYVRRERFDAQVADMQYSDRPVQSWHAQLVNALETWATWEYNGGAKGWGKGPDYSQMDRIAKTLV